MASSARSKAGESGQAPSDDLGPLVMEQKIGQPDVVALLIWGVLLLFFGPGVAVIVPKGAASASTVQLAIGGIVTLAGLGLLIAGIIKGRRGREWKVFLHGRGIVERRGSESVILFDEADELEYKITHVHVNGAYTGTNDHLRLRTGGPNARSVLFQRRRDERKSRKSGIPDPNPLDEISNRIAGRIAVRIFERLEQGQAVAWTPRMTIRLDGLEIARKPFKERDLRDMFKRREATQVAWNEVDRADIDNGIFRLWIKGEPRPRVEVATGENNFHPGYRVVATILKEDSRRASTPVKRPDPRELGHGEKIELEYARTIADLIALDHHESWNTPKGRKQRLEGILTLPVIAAGLGLLIVVTNYNRGQMGRDLFLIGLVASLGGGLLLIAVLEGLIAMAARRRVARWAGNAHELSKTGQAQDPFKTYQLTLGPPGFFYRTRYGELRRSWAEIARVEWDRGSIFFHLAGDKVDRESVDLMIPAHAFDDRERARDAFERIKHWQQAMQAG